MRPRVSIGTCAAAISLPAIAGAPTQFPWELPLGYGEEFQQAFGTDGLTSAGKVSEARSYLRWEAPILGINGEGRISPMMQGCQVITASLDKDGETMAHNEIWMTPESKGLDHAAALPHTAGRQGGGCKSCHDNPKALGYGIEDGRFLQGYDKAFTDAFALFAKEAAKAGVCLPHDPNRATEVRWAFTRWAHDDFAERDTPALEGLLETLRTRFKCA